MILHFIPVIYIQPDGGHVGFAKSQNCEPHGIVDLWAKFGVLGRMWPKQSFYCPDYLQICMCNRPRVVVDVQFPMKTVQIVLAYPSVLPS